MPPDKSGELGLPEPSRYRRRLLKNPATFSKDLLERVVNPHLRRRRRSSLAGENQGICKLNQ
ncbi:MAG TPA: hypothetical protein VGM62_20500 [Chthoniobacterales bacterium]